MNDIVRYEKGQPVQLNEITKSDSSSSSTAEEQILCTHDGVLLRNASAEYILDQDMNNSGSLSLMELQSNKRMFFEWRPNDSIVITDDDYCDDHDQEWSIVDKIQKRSRTTSECRIFNCEKSVSPNPKPKCIRVDIEHLRSIELTSKGRCVRFKRKSGDLHSEYFFQHGNADIFIKALQSFHIIEGIQGNRSEYPIINSEPQKLIKTFAMLELDEIKNSQVHVSRIFSNPIADFLTKVGSGAARLSPVSRRTSPTEYEDLGIQESHKEEQKEKENGEKMEKDSQETEEKKRRFSLPAKKIVSRGDSLTEASWSAQKTADGQIHNPALLKQTIFRGGIDPPLRCEVWKYLLGFYDWNQTTSQLAEHRRRKSTEYYQMKAQWLSMSIKQEQNFSGYRDRKAQIEKDVKRTDRSMTYFAGDENKNLMVLQDILMTYVMYNFDLGYVQGMSDLLAPILIIQQNEVDAFWCFVGFMDMVYSNFDIDQAGMKKQLSYLTTLLEYCNVDLYDYFKSNGSDNMYFCFRWLLVWFKREFSNEDILVLWESLWTGLPCQNFHLLLSIAILEQETQTIIENEFSFTDILKHVNDLSMSINLKYSLELAEAIFVQIRDSQGLTNKLRVIVGLDLVEGEDGDEVDGQKQEDLDDSFDDIVRELTPDEKKLKEQKLEEACEQSMFLSFM